MIEGTPSVMRRDGVMLTILLSDAVVLLVGGIALLVLLLTG